MKVVEVLVPRVVTAPIIATAIRAAIRPYSIAVAPDSFLKNLRIGNSHYAGYLRPEFDFGFVPGTRTSLQDCSENPVKRDKKILKIKQGLVNLIWDALNVRKHCYILVFIRL